MAGNLLLFAPVHSLAAVVLLASACTTLEPSELSPPVEPPPLIEDVIVAPGGPHRVMTHFDLDLDALAPGARLTETLTAYANLPGATMLAAADEANVPALATLRADLPDAIEQRLAGWIDESISPLARLSVLSIEYAVERSLAEFDLQSELAFFGDTVTHRLLAIDFTPAGFELRFAIEPVEGEVHSTTAPIMTSNYSLTIGDHELSVGVGGFAWDAVDANMAEMGGLRGVVGALTQCPIVALMVAAKCDGSTCVGHVDQLQELCERALDQMVVQGRAEASNLTFVTLGLEGHAGMNDSNKDGVGESLFGGRWTLKLDTGFATVTSMTTFE